jgi:hypothetical protein
MSFWTRERERIFSTNLVVSVNTICFTGQSLILCLGICKGQAPTTFNLDNMLVHMHGEDKIMFIRFVKRMLKWEPEERSTAGELLQDAWLYS